MMNKSWYMIHKLCTKNTKKLSFIGKHNHNQMIIIRLKVDFLLIFIDQIWGNEPEVSLSVLTGGIWSVNSYLCSRETSLIIISAHQLTLCSTHHHHHHISTPVQQCGDTEPVVLAHHQLSPLSRSGATEVSPALRCWVYKHLPRQTPALNTRQSKHEVHGKYFC